MRSAGRQPDPSPVHTKHFEMDAIFIRTHYAAERMHLTINLMSIFARK